MKGPSVALLASTIGLVGCAGPAELLFKNSIVVDHLEGNYQRLARCTYQHLARQPAQLSLSDLREQETVRIALTKAPQTYWELSFVNEDGGESRERTAYSPDIRAWPCFVAHLTVCLSIGNADFGWAVARWCAVAIRFVQARRPRWLLAP